MRLRRHLLPIALTLAVGTVTTAVTIERANDAAAATVDPLPDGGIGVRIGGTPALIGQYESWLGREMDTALLYFDGDTPARLRESAPALLSKFRGTKYRTLVISMPLVLQGQTLSSVAAGANDQIFRDLAAVMVANGRGDDIVRPGWEFNGAWFPWSGIGQWETFASAFRRAVTTMRSVPGAENLRFEWNFGKGGAPVPDSAYPGDQYVDIIGMDVYDRSYSSRLADPVVRWDNYMQGSPGFAWHRDFAARHGKPMAFSEWGISSGHVSGSNPDNPYFIQQMHSWIQSNNVAYAIYFERDTNFLHRLMLHYPNARAVYRNLFGTAGQPSTTTTTTTAPSTTTTTRPATTTTTTAPSTTTTTTAPPTTTTRPAGGESVADSFDGTALDPTWSIVDPMGHASVSLGGGSVRLSVPSGFGHDLWRSNRTALRLVRPVPAGGLETVEARFDSSPTGLVQSQGVVLEASDGELLRFDILRTPAGRQWFIGSVSGGASTELARSTLPGTGPIAIRVTRSGNSWSLSVANGTGAYTHVRTVNRSFTASRAGLWVGDAGSAPGHSVLVTDFLMR